MNSSNKKRRLKLERIHNANKFLESIASCGRRFFEHDHGIGFLEVAKFEENDTGHLYFFESWHRQWHYVSRGGEWCWFHNGGTLRSLIESLIEYIKTGEALSYGESYWKHWAYGDDMKTVIDCGVALGVIESPRQIT